METKINKRTNMKLVFFKTGNSAWENVYKLYCKHNFLWWLYRLRYSYDTAVILNFPLMILVLEETIFGAMKKSFHKIWRLIRDDICILSQKLLLSNVVVNLILIGLLLDAKRCIRLGDKLQFKFELMATWLLATENFGVSDYYVWKVDQSIKNIQVC